MQRYLLPLSIYMNFKLELNVVFIYGMCRATMGRFCKKFLHMGPIFHEKNQTKGTFFNLVHHVQINYGSEFQKFG